MFKVIKEEKMEKITFDKRNIVNVISLAIFYWVFLGSEYMFDNMMTKATDSAGVVMAQNFILGVSVLGFLAYALFYKKLMKSNIRIFVQCVVAVLILICFIVLNQSEEYLPMLIAGGVLFYLIGILGAGIHYLMSNMLLCMSGKSMASFIGIGYAIGILLQFINNNIVRNNTLQTIFIFIGIMFILYVNGIMEENTETDINRSNQSINNLYVKTPNKAAVLMMITVALMTCIFSTLDNAVTLVHAAGSVDIGQWPRIFLSVSGFLAGFIFDISLRRYMNVIMYCITLLSVICVVVIAMGGPFIVGLLFFYVSAGFFVVYFTTVFMELSRFLEHKELWAGMGRIVNNACAVIISIISVKLLSTQNNMVMSIMALVLFAMISVFIYAYSSLMFYNGNPELNRVHTEMSQVQPALNKSEEVVNQTAAALNESDEDEAEIKYRSFIREYSFTTREAEVLKALISSDENVSDIAGSLNMSRTAIYRHISSMNEKTNTKSRVGLIQFYYNWEVVKKENYEY